ncbi:uncharacterized protein LOC125177927 [Hyalella azteca]|uniref:Uncharacterized protein LOC125177927 n=1 Tax=Hyalella azteca TaxID=294128 RepID=A0A979FK02_HYAAZ|nr:uncharacterized protein LOC125177927 [Hyalella azteca]
MLKLYLLQVQDLSYSTTAWQTVGSKSHFGAGLAFNAVPCGRYAVRVLVDTTNGSADPVYNLDIRHTEVQAACPTLESTTLPGASTSPSPGASTSPSPGASTSPSPGASPSLSHAGPLNIVIAIIVVVVLVVVVVALLGTCWLRRRMQRRRVQRRLQNPVTVPLTHGDLQEMETIRKNVEGCWELGPKYFRKILDIECRIDFRLVYIRCFYSPAAFQRSIVRHFSDFSVFGVFSFKCYPQARQAIARQSVPRE